MWHCPYEFDDHRWNAYPQQWCGGYCWPSGYGCTSGFRLCSSKMPLSSVLTKSQNSRHSSAPSYPGVAKFGSA